MVLNTLLERINTLPIIVKNDNDVLDVLKENLNDYASNIESLSNFQYTRKVKDINKIILKTFEHYYNGMPNKAFTEIKKLFTQKNITEFLNIDTIVKMGYENEYKQLYRVRLGENIYELTDIFHNPFNNRHIIPTNRYSIPGFPCLYLSGSILGCWIEMDKPDIDKLSVSRFEADKDLKILDLATLPHQIDKFDASEYKYLVTWPLICACAIRVKDNNRTFKSEYIIPQLLLQLLREIKDIDGIRYFSVKTEYQKVNRNPIYINYVFPADIENKITIKNYDYSKNLIDNFKVTPPIHIAIFNNFNGAGRSSILATALNRGCNNILDNKLENTHWRHGAPIEVAKGYYIRYGSNNFFQLEEVLCGIPTEKIIEEHY